jgi:hypothetical protein
VITTASTRPIQPLIGIACPVIRCSFWIRWNVVTVVHTAGTMISAPSVIASVDFPGLSPSSVVPLVRP